MATETRTYLEPSQRTGLTTLYVKLFGSITTPHSTGIIAAVEVGGGYYTFAGLDTTLDYTVYEEASSGTQAVTDTALGVLTAGSLAANAASLAAISAKTDLIGTGSATVSAPVTVNGELNPIIQGQDYTGDNAFVWTVDEYTDFVVGSTTVLFSGVTAACTDPVQGWEVAGTVTDNLDGTWEVTAELTQAITAALDETLNYDWSVQLTYNSLDRVPVKSNIKRPVSVLKKQNT